MKFSGTPAAKKLKAFSITSSPFYWNLPDSEPNSFVQDSEVDIDPFPCRDAVHNALQRLRFPAGSIISPRIDIDKASHTLRVRFFTSQGMPLSVPDSAGHLTGNKLELAPW